MIKVIYDMETADPDDILALLLLAGHPKVNLKGVTLYPGGEDQYGLVKWVLNELNLEHVPVGTGHRDRRNKKYVSEWHYHAFGDISPLKPEFTAEEVLQNHCGKDVIFVEGASLRNLGRAMQHSEFTLFQAVIQGGFAGENIVPRENVLPEYQGVHSMQSFNLSSSKGTAMDVQTDPRIQNSLFISKNVTHGLIYDQALHRHVAQNLHRNPALALIWQGMEHYLKKHPEGKKLHDPLAAACAIDETVCEYKEVKLHYHKENHFPEWYSELSPGSNVRISISVDRAKFEAVFLMN